jgi:hypothetical protein
MQYNITHSLNATVAFFVTIIYRLYVKYVSHVEHIGAKKLSANILYVNVLLNEFPGVYKQYKKQHDAAVIDK